MPIFKSISSRVFSTYNKRVIFNSVVQRIPRRNRHCQSTPGAGAQQLSWCLPHSSQAPARSNLAIIRRRTKITLPWCWAWWFFWFHLPRGLWVQLSRCRSWDRWDQPDKMEKLKSWWNFLQNEEDLQKIEIIYRTNLKLFPHPFEIISSLQSTWFLTHGSSISSPSLPQPPFPAPPGLWKIWMIKIMTLVHMLSITSKYIGVSHTQKNLCTIVHNNFMNEIHVWRKKPVTTFYIMKWYLKEGFRRKVDFVFFQVAPGNKGPPDGIQTTQQQLL